MDTTRKAILTMLLAAFIVAGGYAAVVAASDLRLASEAEGWPSTEGTIVRSVQHGRRWLELRYNYEVQGQLFSGHRASFRDGKIRFGRRTRREMYSVGSSVTVYYAPNEPSNSVLEIGIYWPGIVLHGMASLLTMAVGSVGLYLTFRRK